VGDVAEIAVKDGDVMISRQDVQRFTEGYRDPAIDGILVVRTGPSGSVVDDQRSGVPRAGRFFDRRDGKVDRTGILQSISSIGGATHGILNADVVSTGAEAVQHQFCGASRPSAIRIADIFRSRIAAHHYQHQGAVGIPRTGRRNHLSSIHFHGKWFGFGDFYRNYFSTWTTCTYWSVQYRD